MPARGPKNRSGNPGRPDRRRRAGAAPLGHELAGIHQHVRRRRDNPASDSDAVLDSGGACRRHSKACNGKVVNSPTVLLVGSDEALLTGLAEMLAASGHTVVACPCFDEAKRYLQTATPHAIVTDVRLGAFNGLHLVLLAKEKAPATTAIVYSGREDSGLRQDAATSGATYLEKEMLSVGLLAHLHGIEASA